MFFSPLQIGGLNHICFYSPHRIGEAASVAVAFNWPVVCHILFRAGPAGPASSSRDVAQARTADTARLGRTSRARDAGKYSGGFSSIWAIECC